MAEVMVTDLRGDLQRIKAPVDVIYAWDKAGHFVEDGPRPGLRLVLFGSGRWRRLRIDDARHYIMFDQPGPFYGGRNMAGAIRMTDDWNGHERT